MKKEKSEKIFTEVSPGSSSATPASKARSRSRASILCWNLVPGLLLDWTKLPELTGSEHCGNQHESWTSAWRVVRRFDREVADGSKIHRSVRLRLEDTKKKFKPHPYAPVRLTKPWERFEWHPEK